MKIIRQFTLILLLTLIAELLHILLPFPIPASIYGIVLLFVLLETGVIRVGAIDQAAGFLIEIMPLMFIPAAAGLLETFPALMPSLGATITITLVSTVVVMAVSGLMTQALIRRKRGREDAA